MKWEWFAEIRNRPQGWSLLLQCGTGQFVNRLTTLRAACSISGNQRQQLRRQNSAAGGSAEGPIGESDGGDHGIGNDGYDSDLGDGRNPLHGQKSLLLQQPPMASDAIFFKTDEDFARAGLPGKSWMEKTLTFEPVESFRRKKLRKRLFVLRLHFRRGGAGLRRRRSLIWEEEIGWEKPKGREGKEWEKFRLLSAGKKRRTCRSFFLSFFSSPREKIVMLTRKVVWMTTATVTLVVMPRLTRVARTKKMIGAQTLVDGGVVPAELKTVTRRKLIACKQNAPIRPLLSKRKWAVTRRFPQGRDKMCVGVAAIVRFQLNCGNGQASRWRHGTTWTALSGSNGKEHDR